MPQTDPIPAASLRCHHTGFKTACRKLVVDGRCQKWVAVKGRSPQDGEEMNYHGCVDSWMPTLFMDFAKMTNRVAGEVEAQRRESAAQSSQTNALLGTIVNLSAPAPPPHDRALPDRTSNHPALPRS